MNTILEKNLMLPYQFVILTKDKTSSNELSKMEILSYAEFVSISAQIKPAITFFIMNTPLDVEWVAHFRPMSESFYVVTINDMINPYKYQHAADGVIDLQKEQLPHFYQAISSICINYGIIQIDLMDFRRCLDGQISKLYTYKLNEGNLESSLHKFLDMNKQNLFNAKSILAVITTGLALKLEQFVMIGEEIQQYAPNTIVNMGTGLEINETENNDLFSLSIFIGK